MNKQCLLLLSSWFDNYVQGFSSEDLVQQRNMDLKKEHTLRVMENITLIGQSLSLTGEELALAKVVALFHDLGRFEQFKKYGTFKDGKSENHALLGVKVLENSQILDCLSQPEKEIVYQAVRQHNVCQLPVDLPEKVLFYSRLIRDADKLDIFKLLTEYYEERENNPNPALEELPDTYQYSAKFVQDILQERKIRYEEVRSFQDMTLLRLSWIFDLNFPYTKEKVQEGKYLEKFIRSLPKTPEIQEVYHYLNNYLNR